MAKIGIVLAGGAAKGAYEIGVIRAIDEFFGIESIKCVSSASIGTLITQAYGHGKLDKFTEIWKSIDPKKHGRFILLHASSHSILKTITDNLATENNLPYEHYVCLLNFTKRRADYCPFHTLAPKKLKKYIKAAVAMPGVSLGEVVDRSRYFDGAFIDNIPVYPLKDKDLDYIFCIYFDQRKYFFEDEELNRKVIKLNDFPNEKATELLIFSPDDMDKMIEYGYEYTMKTLKEIFVSEDKEEIYSIIAQRDSSLVAEHEKRFTVDVALTNVNDVIQRYTKRMSKRVDLEAEAEHGAMEEEETEEIESPSEAK